MYYYILCDLNDRALLAINSFKFILNPKFLKTILLNF